MYEPSFCAGTARGSVVELSTGRRDDLDRVAERVSAEEPRSALEVVIRREFHVGLLVDDVEGLVFPSEAGTVIDSSNLMERVLKKAGREAGVPWVGFHTFRHSCAPMLFRAGWNAKQVQMHMGHHSPAFTLATYVHFLDDDLPSADFLDGVTGGGNNLATSPTETQSRLVGDEEAEPVLFAGETPDLSRAVGG
jgi:hypothetical protein